MVPRFEVDPSAEAQTGFEDVKPGTYPMRIVEATEGVGQSSGEPNIKWRLEHVTSKDQLVNQGGKPLTGTPGGLFYYTNLTVGKQGMLRALVEAALGEWRSAESDELLGKEVQVVVKNENYNGELRNKVARIVKVG